MVKNNSIGSFLPGGNSPTDGQYSTLIVRKRVLKADNRIVQISNIASVGIFESKDQTAKKVIYALVILVCILGALQNLSSFGGLPVAISLFAVAGLFLVMLIGITKDYYLFVGLNSGAVLRFESKDEKFMQGALDFMETVMNTPALDLNAEFNFKDNLIIQGDATVDAKSLQVSGDMPVESIAVESVISGDNNTVAPGATGAVFGAGSAGNTANFGDANSVEVVDVEASADNTTINVEFGALTSQVELLRDRLAPHSNYAATAEKLDELSALMKAGAPTSEDKSRVRQICEDAALALQSLPPAMNVINQVAAVVSAAV